MLKTSSIIMREVNINQATLLYRATCKKCCLLSWLVVVFSLGCVRRIPNNGEEALYQLKKHGVTASKAMLIAEGTVYSGYALITAILKAMQYKLICLARHAK